MAEDSSTKKSALGERAAADGVLGLAPLIARVGHIAEGDACLSTCTSAWADPALMDAVSTLRHAPRQRTRLMYACFRGDVARARWLLERGADVQVAAGGSTPMTLAIGCPSASLVQLLCERGVSARVAQHGENLVCLAAERYLQAVKLDEGEAVQAQVEECVRTLVTFGAELDRPYFGSFGVTPLGIAGRCSARFVRLLLELGATLDYRPGVLGETALVQACTQGEPLGPHADDPVPMVQELHQRGADINSGHCRALKAAIEYCMPDTVAYLLQNGADATLWTHDTRKPDYKAMDGHLRVTDSHGSEAATQLADRIGRTAKTVLEHATEANRPIVVGAMLSVLLTVRAAQTHAAADPTPWVALIEAAAAASVPAPAGKAAVAMADVAGTDMLLALCASFPALRGEALAYASFKCLPALVHAVLAQGPFDYSIRNSGRYETEDGYEFSPVGAACYNMDLEMATLLLDAGVCGSGPSDFSVGDESESQPLVRLVPPISIAVFVGHVDMVRLLAQRVPIAASDRRHAVYNFHTRRLDEVPVLCDAVRLGQVEIADVLIKAGAEVNKAATYADGTVLTPLGMAINMANKEAATLLMSHKDVLTSNVAAYPATEGLPASIPGDSYSHVGHALMLENVDMLKHLLSLGADPRVSSSMLGWTSVTPMAQAVLANLPDAVQALVDCAAGDEEEAKLRADMLQGDSKAAGPDWAAANDAPLLKPLHIAARDGLKGMVELLCDKGALINIRTTNGTRCTPLMLAAQRGHEAVVRALLQCGASVTAMDEDGLTAADHAARQGHEELLPLLATPSSGEIQALREEVQGLKAELQGLRALLQQGQGQGAGAGSAAAGAAMGAGAGDDMEGSAS